MPLVLFALAVAWAVMLLFGGLDLDRALLLFFHAGERPEIARPARILTELGGYLVLMPLMAAGALWLAWKRRFRDAALLLAVTISGRLLVEIQKVQMGRIRPQENTHLVEVHSLSFPSAHAANSAMVYLSLALLLTSTWPRRALALWAAAWLSILIGTSRVVLGVHWPSDVIAGWAFGLFWTLLLLHLAGRDLGDGTPRAVRHSSPEGAST
jgi:undecaprenyl-diphosphatase